MTLVRIAFWNLNWRTNRVALSEKAALIADVEADVFLVAECDQATFEALAARFGSGGHAFGLDEVPHTPRAMGCAVLVSNGRLVESRVLSELPRPERGVLARVEHNGRRFDVFAWHAPHAVGSGPDRMAGKMSAYRVALDLFNHHQEPLVVGCDMNTPWFDPWQRLDPMRPSSDPFHDDDRVYGAHQAHALLDAWRLHLEAHHEQLERILRLRPLGPLAVSHDRGNQGSTLPCRYDHILVSPGTQVVAAGYRYEDAVGARSDHAIVWADLMV